MYVPPVLLVGEVMQTFHDLSQSTQTRELLLQFDDFTAPIIIENIVPAIQCTTQRQALIYGIVTLQGCRSFIGDAFAL